MRLLTVSRQAHTAIELLEVIAILYCYDLQRKTVYYTLEINEIRKACHMAFMSGVEDEIVISID